MRLLIVLLCSMVGACSSLPGAVNVPVPVHCAPANSPTPPKVSPNGLLAKMDDYHLILIIASERNDLIDYAGKADAIIQACK